MRKQKVWWGFSLLFFLLLISACQPAHPLATDVSPTLTFTKTISPTLTTLPTVTATQLLPTPKPQLPLSLERPWLAYASRTKLTVVNQDGTGFTTIYELGRSPGDMPPCNSGTGKSFMLDESPSNRMADFGWSGIYVVQPPVSMRVYRPGWFYCGAHFAFRWQDNDTLLASIEQTTQKDIPTLKIYEMPSGKIRDQIPLVKCAVGAFCDVLDIDTWKVEWSPNGRYLAFQAIRDASATDLYIYDSQNRSIRQLTHDPDHVSQFWWSPDSAWIVFGEASLNYGAPTAETLLAVSLQGNIRHLYDFKPAQQESIFEWLDNKRFLMIDGNLRDVVNQGAYSMSLVDISTGVVTSIFGRSMGSAVLDGANKAVVIFAFYQNGYDQATYLVPLAHPTPQFVTDMQLDLTWDSDLGLFVADSSDLCEGDSKKLQVLDLAGKLSCIQRPEEDQSKENASLDPALLSPDKKWQVWLNEKDVWLENMGSKSKVVVKDSPGMQVIWCLDSTCFFLVSNHNLYRVSVPDLTMKSIDSALDGDTISAKWLERK